ncbi:gag_pre-integrs domain-containing protein [Cephalotus follicularis]|uniref:Gag_pre-integrs domain-containing protein n=1 Tax=Cephalotus follicularis TaxID=3775 RepID=A0A1Q3BVD7_CEPFO|nr:gag_pre-integrs domain-containing protein [Cephalotus follicularis]
MIFDKRSMNLIYSVKMTANKMFPIMFSNVTINAFSASNDESMLCHRRFGHLIFSGLHLLHKLNMASGCPMMKNDHKVCEACIIGKPHRDKFPVSMPWRANKPLMLVHADICGPMQTLSLNESNFLIFVDDFSRMLGCIFLRRNLKHLKFLINLKQLLKTP